jgi:ComF family protein
LALVAATNRPLRDLLGGALRLAGEILLPPACIACHAVIGPRLDGRHDAATLICPDCRQLLHPLAAEGACPRCGAVPTIVSAGTPSGSCDACAHFPAALSAVRSVYPYYSPAGAIVRNMKYQRAPYLAEHLVDLALGQTEAWFAALPRPIVVVAMPMHPWRELRRGYNQAGWLAGHLARRLGATTAPEGALRRIRRAPPQARFGTRAQRLANLEGVFAIGAAEAFAGRHLLLVDDVMTSGATLASAAAVLASAGPASMHGFTPVRALMGDDADDAPGAGPPILGR